MKKNKNNNSLYIIIIIIILVLISLFSLNIILNKKNNSNNINSAVSDSTNYSTLLSGKDFIEKFKNTQNSILLDVRTPAEYGESHISEAVNIDYENASFTENISKLDKEKTYFVYCRSGRRSGEAVKIMHSIGFNNIYELGGGISINSNLLK